MALGAWEADGGAETRETHGSGERVRRLTGGWSRAHGHGRREARGCGGLVAHGVDGGDQAAAWAALLVCSGVGERRWRRGRSKSGG